MADYLSNLDYRGWVLLACSAILILLGAILVGLLVAWISTLPRERREKRNPVAPLMVPAAQAPVRPFAAKKPEVTK